jgi:putative colanic acid biosynthesis glycosyltransferase
MNSNPQRALFTIVTVSYNCCSLIEKTIKSVLQQDYHDTEYIIIDGESTDGTVEIIKKYAQHLAFWCSEPDGGIYQGMNKGISHAKGEWILFLNAGDVFAETNVLTKVLPFTKNKEGHSVNVSKNKMAYEVILAYYLHMPLLLAFFSYFLT